MFYELSIIQQGSSLKVMILDYCYVFWFVTGQLVSCPEQICLKTIAVKYQRYFIPKKFHQNSSSGFEGIQNVKIVAAGEWDPFIWYVIESIWDAFRRYLEWRSIIKRVYNSFKETTHINSVLMMGQSTEHTDLDQKYTNGSEHVSCRPCSVTVYST